MSAPPTIAHILADRAARTPQRLAFRFLENGTPDGRQTEWSYADLAGRAAAIAARLTEEGADGRPVLLVYPPGLDYVAAFFGCLWAGLRAVPAFPPDLRRPAEGTRRLTAIARNCGAEIALTNDGVMPLVSLWPTGTSAHQIRWLSTSDCIEAPAGSTPAARGDGVAFLQYTSGSTGDPKGVCVSHRNIVHNLGQIRDAFARDDTSVGVGWLPLYHDMGLIGHVLQPVFTGAPSVLMSPLDFLRAPLNWLRAISAFGAHTSGGPNFAYQLCVARAARSTDALKGLDLSSWTVAYSGAEPVRASTLDAFADTFGPYGFDRRAFLPCYGLAEATLFVTGAPAGRGGTVTRFDAADARRGRLRPADDGRPLVSCGRPRGDQTVIAVDPETRIRCPDGVVGEVWVRGESVASGYFREPESIDGAFCGRLDPEDPHRWLRTGDLGALHDGELYVTGRLKDVVIHNGENFAPTDLEATAATAHPQVRPGGCLATSIAGPADEELAIFIEVRAHHADIAPAVRLAISRAHGITPRHVLLMAKGTLPRTSSGKLRRSACRDAWLDGQLDVLEHDRIGTPEQTAPRAVTPTADSAAEAFVRHTVAELLALDADGIDTDDTLRGLGLDSIGLADLRERIQARFGLDLPLTAFADPAVEPTIGALARLVDAAADGPDVERALTDPSPDVSGPASAVPEGLEDVARAMAARLGSTGDDAVDVFAPARAFELPGMLARRGLDAFYKTYGRYDGEWVEQGGRRLLMLGSHDYLGLAQHPDVRRAAIRAVEEAGTSRSGSRLHNGSTDAQRRFERAMAGHLGKEDCLTFASGYMALAGLITGLMTPDSQLVLDDCAHASSHDGALIARCRTVRFAHNDPADLDRRLTRLGGRRPTLVVIEGLYSNEGDVAPLPEVLAVCRRHGARLAVDDAHGFGVLGAAGRGIEDHFGGAAEADVVAGTFSKALGSIGGWIAGPAHVIEWIRYHARTILFSAAIAPPQLAAAAAALDVLRREPERVTRLQRNAAWWRACLRERGFDVDLGETPIVPVLIGSDTACLEFARRLNARGVAANCVLHPSVPPDMAMVRTCITALHTRASLERAAAIFAEVAQALPTRGFRSPHPDTPSASAPDAHRGIR